MNFNQFILACQKKVKENPKAGKMKVVYSVDDEGNSFEDVKFIPTSGKLTTFGLEYDVPVHEHDSVCIN